MSRSQKGELTLEEACELLVALPDDVRLFLADLLASAWVREMLLGEWPKKRLGEISPILQLPREDSRPGALLATPDREDPTEPAYVVGPTCLLMEAVHTLIAGRPAGQEPFGLERPDYVYPRRR